MPFTFKIWKAWVIFVCKNAHVEHVEEGREAIFHILDWVYTSVLQYDYLWVLQDVVLEDNTCQQ